MEKAVTGGKPPVLMKQFKNNDKVMVVEQVMHASFGNNFTSSGDGPIFFLNSIGIQRFLTFECTIHSIY